MRKVNVQKIIDEVAQMCQEANYVLSNDMVQALEEAKDKEVSPIGKSILEDLNINMSIAKEESIPICQDTGTAVVFVTIGQEVYIEGGSLEDAINEGVRKGYTEGYLRKSIVKNPLYRENTKDNTPAIIHYEIVSGDTLNIMLAPKGGGSENMSKVYMLKPSQGIEGVKTAVLEAVEAAGPNACLPLVVGIGIGGNFEKCTYLAKKALTRKIGVSNKDKKMAELEQELLEMINNTGIGPQGLGGVVTALAVHIEDYPCHIASLPLAINMGCHVNRHISRKI
ncbi:MAG: fumarate hydratase [Cellulosilyticaceae bacterium]